MIIVATSNKIFAFTSLHADPQIVLTRDNNFHLLRKKGLGFFGVDYCSSRNSVFVAERHHWYITPYANKPSTDMRLYEINLATLKVNHYAWIRDIHDVHQIAVYNNWIFITDTGKNRIIVFDIVQKKVVKEINIGFKREDVHHINALLIQGSYLMVNCNNLGHGVSELIQIPLVWIEQANNKAVIEGDDFFVENFYQVEHTHDIEMKDGVIYYCASKQGQVFVQNEPKPIIQLDRWTRGLAFVKDKIWVGLSQMTGREDRHSTILDGSIAIYDLYKREKLQEIIIPNVGQVNDILVVDQ